MESERCMEILKNVVENVMDSNTTSDGISALINDFGFTADELMKYFDISSDEIREFKIESEFGSDSSYVDFDELCVGYEDYD